MKICTGVSVGRKKGAVLNNEMAVFRASTVVIQVKRVIMKTCSISKKKTATERWKLNISLKLT